MQDKKALIKLAAKVLIERVGLINLTRSAVCDEAGVPDGSFPNIMGQSFTDFVTTLAPGTTDHAITKKRLSKDDRKDHILKTALLTSKSVGYTNVTRAVLAKEAEVSESLISHYFGTMTQLKRGIMRAAIDAEIPEIVAQGLSVKDSNALKAPDALKQMAAAVLVS